MGARSRATAKSDASLLAERAPAADELAAYCPDLEEWPRSWMYEERDLSPGQQVVDYFKPFLRHLLRSELSRKTLRKHRDNGRERTAVQPTLGSIFTVCRRASPEGGVPSLRPVSRAHYPVDRGPRTARRVHRTKSTRVPSAPRSLCRVSSLAGRPFRASPARFEFLDEGLTVRRMPVLEKHLLQLQAIDDRIIAVDHCIHKPLTESWNAKDSLYDEASHQNICCYNK